MKCATEPEDGQVDAEGENVLKLENTPNRLGIRTKGDAEEICALYDVVGRYGDCGLLGDGWGISDNSTICGGVAGCVRLLDVENRSGHHSLDMLYPWALYYLVSFTAALAGDGSGAAQTAGKTSGSSPAGAAQAVSASKDVNVQIQRRKDRVLLEYFVLELWRCLFEVFGEEKGQLFYQLTEAAAREVPFDFTYIEVLCSYFCDEKKNDGRLREAMLTAMLCEFVDAERLGDPSGQRVWTETGGPLGLPDPAEIEKLAERACAYRREALDYIQKKTGEPYLSDRQFRSRLKNILNAWPGLTEAEQDSFLDGFGSVDWKKLEL